MMKTMMVALLMTLSTAAFADGPAKATTAPAAAPAANAKAAKVKIYDFTKEDVTGEIVRPTGEGFNVLDYGKAASLIHVRREFLAEITKTAEDL